MPTVHIQNLYELDDATAARVMSVAAMMARAVRDAFSPDGLRLWQSNGPVAHQELPHFHLHVMPRWESAGLLRIYPNRVGTPPMSDRAAMADQIRARLA